jgi:hypothetical protein
LPGQAGFEKCDGLGPEREKRGGLRAVYYYRTSAGIVYMLDIYAKNEKADLTPADKRELREIISFLEG